MNCEGKLVLGLDIGSNSLGWSLIKLDNNGRPSGIQDIGVRIFEAGMDGDISSGKAESRNANRRNKRQIRRQLRRRAQRLKILFEILQTKNLLPPGNDINKIISILDKELLKKYQSQTEITIRNRENLPHVLPYFLRALALDKKLENYELGRAIYHLAQRRGFLSNRKSVSKEEDGVVKKSISDLEKTITESKSRTLGEYFSRLNPEEDKIRRQWTSRKMFLDEFDMIWESQVKLGNAILSKDLKKEIHNKIFFQRPLKSVKHLIGKCQFELERSRCPWFRLEAQRFRLLQTVNNLNIIPKNGIIRDLTSEEWTKIINALENSETMSVAKLKNLIGIPKTSKFNIEDGDISKLEGNKTNAKLIKVFGERWSNFTLEQKEQIIEDINSFEKEDALIRRAKKEWGLDHDSAENFSKIELEEGYCNLSRQAILKLLPKLEEGIPLSRAVKEVYGNIQGKTEIHDQLPPIDEIMEDLRNPVVHRCLTEVRKVVNSLVRKYGKFESVHIELARDIKNSKKEKRRILDKNKQNERERDEAKDMIFKELKRENPSRDDILKVRLWNECNKECPYTQKSISISSLLGENPQFDIEHIIPFSVSLDDSFANKTLCYHEENRNVKRNRTPFEAYSADKDKYYSIIQSVKRFSGEYATEKLRRFLLEDISEYSDFSNRQLNDTRYASKEAKNYIGLLYGGEIDEKGKRRIQANSGGITYIIRSFYGMNNILGDGVKNRDDHRHHAVDATAIALTTTNAVKTITSHVKNLEKEKVFSRFKVPEAISPWKEFHSELKEKINKIIVSHHISKKVRGAFHKDTFYGFGQNPNKITSRIELKELTKNDISNIIDKKIKLLIEDKLSQLKEDSPNKAFKNPSNLPLFNKKPIQKAKVAFELKTINIGQENHIRKVVSGNNHHIEIVALLNDKGDEIKWEGHVVSLFEAKRRLSNDEPVVKRDFGDSKKFKFSLACGDIIELENENGGKGIYVIRCVPQSLQIMFVHLNEAREQKEIKADRRWFTAYPDPLRKRNCRKLSITPLGELQNAND